MVDVMMEICCRVDGGLPNLALPTAIPHCTISCGSDSTVISHILKSLKSDSQCWIMVLAVSLSGVLLSFFLVRMDLMA